MYKNKLSSKACSYGAHLVSEDCIKAVTEVLKSHHLTCGAKVEAFEEAIAKTVGSKYAVACSNGTAALHLASLVLDIKPNDYVVVPSITFLATANVARYCGAKVVFCDVDPENGLVTYETLLKAILTSPRKPIAFYPVDLGGQPSSSSEIKALCDEYNIKIIQDSCHSFGTTYLSGNLELSIGDNYFSDLTTFSFHPVKNITTGEGGAISTNDENLYDRMKLLRSHGMTKQSDKLMNSDLAFSNNNQNTWYYEMQELGFNYRLTDIQAALGLSQLKQLRYFKASRELLKKRYDSLLEPFKEFIRPVRQVANSSPCWHLYTVLIDFQKIGHTRLDVVKALSAKGVATQVHYIPLHLQPYYKKYCGFIRLEGAELYYKKALSLPLHLHLGEHDIDIIVDTLIEILERK